MLKQIATVAAVVGGGLLLSKKFRKSKTGGLTSTVEQSIEVNVPVSTAYNQWTQFEDFPKFMHGVREVRQIDPTHLHWRAEVAGKTKEWDSEITEQIPDDRIAWRSVSGAKNAGVVTFHKTSDSSTRIMLQMDFEPDSFFEEVGAAVGAVDMQTKQNLNRFKEFIEGRGNATGAWRGVVPQC